jgi:hypothetical protein
MTTMSHDEIRSMLGAYALDAIDDDERLCIADHLSDCNECAFEVVELLDTASVVALSTHEPVPELLWSKISAGMSTAAGGTSTTVTSLLGSQPESTWPAIVRPEQVVDLTDEVQLESAPAPIATVSDMATHRATRAKRGVSARVVVTAFTSAAAAILIVGPIAQSFIQPKPVTMTSLAAAAEKTTGTRTIDMVSTGDSVTRIGDVVITTNGEGFIRIDDLPVLPDGKTYQLWTVVDGKPVSAGLLGTQPGTAAFVVSSNAQAVALSVEDSVGATQPSVGPIAVAALA